MDLAPSAWSVTSAGIVFILGLLLSVKLSKMFQVSARVSLLLYLWHSLFCVLYLLYVVEYGGDALMYYESSLAGGIEFRFGTAAVQLITSVMSTILGLSLLGAALMFNVIGFVGALAFYGAMRTAVLGKPPLLRYLAAALVFLPSANFWSSGIGKDAIAFLAVGLALWASLCLSRRAWLFALSVGLMLLVRPHIAALLILAATIAMTIEPGVKFLQRVLVGAGSAVFAVVAVPIAISATGLSGDTELEGLVDYVSLRQGYNMHGGGAIDISSMSLPMQLFTYLFRPLPTEASSIPALMASMDNLLVLLVFLVGVPGVLLRRQITDGVNRSLLWVYSLSTWVMLASTTANLGISVRQKWMLLPVLLYLLVSAIGKPRNRTPT